MVIELYVLTGSSVGILSIFFYLFDDVCIVDATNLRVELTTSPSVSVDKESMFQLNPYFLCEIPVLQGKSLSDTYPCLNLIVLFPQPSSSEDWDDTLLWHSSSQNC